MDAHGIDKADLVGNSMGGHLATETAILYPDRVSSLVLLAASGLPPEDGRPHEVPLQIRALGWPLIGPLLALLPSRSLVAEQLKSSVYDPTSIRDDDIDGYHKPLRSRGGLNAMLSRNKQAVAPERERQVAGITTPTLIIAGDSDHVVPPRYAQRYHGLIRDSELIVLKETGPPPQEERPKRIVAEIKRWLSTHPLDKADS